MDSKPETHDPTSPDLVFGVHNTSAASCCLASEETDRIRLVYEYKTSLHIPKITRRSRTLVDFHQSSRPPCSYERWLGIRSIYDRLLERCYLLL